MRETKTSARFKKRIWSIMLMKHQKLRSFSKIFKKFVSNYSVNFTINDTVTSV